VRYGDGAIRLAVTDLSTPRGGLFIHQRHYFNRMVNGPYYGPNGYNWFVTQLPSLMRDGDSIAVVFQANDPYWFDLVSGTYVPRYGVLDVSLTHSGSYFTFTQTSGGRMEVTVFHDFDATTAPGGFVSRTDSAGIETVVAQQWLGRIDELQRSITVGSTTTVESLLYVYNGSGENYNLLSSVTYRRKVGSGDWVNYKRVIFDYYTSSDTQGAAGDLKSAAEQRPNGSSWDTIGIRYYRYWLDGSSAGFAHALKFDIGPEAYRRLFNNNIDPDAADDSTLRQYADHYFEYDPSTQAVTFEDGALAVGCCGSSAGSAGESFAISDNPSHPSPGYNVWSQKAVQTRADGSAKIVYTNYVAFPIITVEVDATGTLKWSTFRRYDGDGRLIVVAQPSAVIGYVEAYDDLVDYDNAHGDCQIRPSDGLLSVTTYYDTTDIANGKVNGYVWKEAVRQGQSGSDVLLREYTYTSNTYSGGPTIYLPKKQTVYPDAASTATKIETSFEYTFFSGTNQMATRTTTLPVVSTGQNGSGTAATTVETFDTFGNLTQRTDERGIVNQYTFDVVLGVMTQQVLNVQSGSGAGLNVTTDMTYDDDARLTQTLGPSHTAEIAGTATAIQTATWNVYILSMKPSSAPWALDEVRTGSGYATSGPTYTLVDPVGLNRKDKNGTAIDQISSKRTSGSGVLSASDTFAQGDWKSWSSSQYSLCNRLLSQRVYHTIPSSGEGSEGTNYAQASYDYDGLQRRIKTVVPGGPNSSPAGTITRVVYGNRNQVKETWLGTNDTGATANNPAGTGSPNNMVKVTANVYDGGSDGGDGKLTQVTHFASDSDTRVTTFGYDWRNRRTSVDGEIDLYVEYTFDNLDRVTRTDRKDTTSSGNLIGRNDILYDDRSRVYQRIIYAVNPSSGEPGNALTENNWFDPSGNLIKQIAAGAGIVFSKNTFNGVGWVTARYTGFNTTNDWSTANSLDDDTIVEQAENTYDEAGNIILVAGYQRLNDATGTGALTAGTQPKARISYSAGWYDGINRSISNAAYGAISSFTRPTTTPTRSDDILVTTIAFDDAGRMYSVVDPKAIELRTTFDDAGRKTQTVEAYGTSDARTTQITYALGNQIVALTAINGTTGDQVTTYTFGTTLSNSDVARNDLLRYIDYPDSVSSSDRVAMTYNRLGQVSTRTDQRATVLALEYDKLGRLTHDRVATVGSDTDDAVRRISRTYEVRGMVEKITSYDNPTVGSGTVLNEVTLAYNDFGQLVTASQEHGGTVTTSSPKVQYGYADGTSDSNQIRPTSLTYPNSRVIDGDYGSSGSLDDRLNRIAAIKDGSTSLAAYTCLGAGAVVRIDYTEPDVMLDLWGGTSGQFDGFDRYGRVIDQRWKYYGGTSADRDRYTYGYDRNSNRQWKQNTVGSTLDEFYTYDNLNRLTVMKRGTLTGSPPTGITGIVRELDWTLDPTGNWPAYITKTSGTTDLSQTRTSNTVNEITDISASVGTAWADPTYDACGNTTIYPKPSSLANSLTAKYDAWNRTIHVKDGANYVAKYKYDGRGARIIKESYTGGSLSETRHFYFTNAWQDIEERIDSDTEPQVQYVWGIRYVDEMICRDRDTDDDGDLDERLYACQDANFNLTAICNTGGSVAERCVFDPYGNRSIRDASWGVISSSAYAWIIGHQGLFYDDPAGLVYNRTRWLNTLLGRFLQRDSRDHSPVGSLYEYVSGRPLRWVDPTGQYGRNVHHDDTLTDALQAMIPADVANTIADCDQGMDDPANEAIGNTLLTIVSLGAMNVWPGHFDRYNHHFPGAGPVCPLAPQRPVIEGYDDNPDVRRYIDTAIANCDPCDFGKALHALQDSYSHGGTHTDKDYNPINSVVRTETVVQWINGRYIRTTGVPVLDSNGNQIIDFVGAPIRSLPDLGGHPKGRPLHGTHEGEVSSSILDLRRNTLVDDPKTDPARYQHAEVDVQRAMLQFMSKCYPCLIDNG
jgi:RHS repeat-associated protein